MTCSLTHARPHTGSDVLVADRSAMISQITGAITNQAYHHFLCAVDGSDVGDSAFEVSADSAPVDTNLPPEQPFP